jgi:hypothetical protein
LLGFLFWVGIIIAVGLHGFAVMALFRAYQYTVYLL